MPFWDGSPGGILPGGGVPGGWLDGLPMGPVDPDTIWVAEILIGNTVVWSSETDTTQQTIELDVSNFTGTQTLKFRIRRTQ